jgi:hypothetical protein
MDALARGWRIFPVRPGFLDPILENWQQRATSDPAQIEAWLRQYPGCNWGAACGPESGFFAVDVKDPRAMQSLEDEYGPVPEGLCICAPLGYTLIYAWPRDAEVRTATNRPCAGIDICGRGFYIVIPPSAQSQDHRYEYSDPTLPIPECPPWLFKLIGAQHETGNRYAGKMGATASRATAEAAATNGGDYWPEPMGPSAFYGLAGDFVNLVLPESESDPQALLLAFLVGAGAIIGGGPYYSVEATRHPVNEYCVIVGKTSKARKGTATERAMSLLNRVSANFMGARRRSGLSSGEGLIQAVRDPREDDVQVNEKGKPPRLVRQVVDKGEADKRLLIVESEFSSVLQQLSRDGNTLSAVLRDAYDGKPIRVMARSNRDSCVSPHISLLGNITMEEVRRLLTTNDKANGFGNRILWCCAKRSKLLPFGGNPLDATTVETLVINLERAFEFAKGIGRLEFDEECRRVWPDIYAELTKEAPGIFGSMTARAEAHTARLFSTYAVLDSSRTIHLPHLYAAKAVWDYCENSVRAIFGDLLGDETADAILRMLKHAPDGMTQTEISNAFGRHKSAAELNRALSLLERQQKVGRDQVQTDGAPLTRWTPYAN